MVDIINNGNVNAPSDGVRQGLFEESSTQKGNVGAERRLEDGRAFRYAYFAAAANRGLLVATDMSATSMAELDNSCTANSIGDSTVTITDATKLGSATADQYAGAYLHMTDDAGEGYTYRITGNTAASSNAVTFTIYDTFLVAATTASDVVITGSPWNSVRAATVGTDYIVSGVTVMNVTANYYAWVQTRGVATILCDGTPAIASQVSLSDGVAGAAELKHDEIAPLVGFTLMAGTDGAHIAVKLYGLD